MRGIPTLPGTKVQLPTGANAAACPFCGKGQTSFFNVTYRGSLPTPAYTYDCQNQACGAIGPRGEGASWDDHAGGQMQALELWNRRRVYRPHRVTIWKAKRDAAKKNHSD